MKPFFSKTHARLLGGVIFLFVLGITIWGGIIGGKQNETKVLGQSNLDKPLDDPSAVKSILSQAEERVLSLKLSGITEPSQTLDLESRMSGTIKKIFVKEGDFVKKGTPLIELAVEDRLRKLESAKSLIKLREMQYVAAKRLAEKNFTSPISLADTEKNLSDAKLTLSQARLELSYLTIKAPFSGIINEVHVESGSVISDMSTDRKVCTLISLHPLYLTIYVNEKIYEQLKMGSAVNVRLADGRVLEGKTDSISVVADPKTRTFEVSILVPNARHTFPAGMTAVVEVPLNMQRTHKLHPSWVTLSKEGVMGIMAIEGGMAVFYPITIIDSSPSHFYVTGLPDQLEIITLGQETVAAGSQVQATLEPQNNGK